MNLIQMAQDFDEKIDLLIINHELCEKECCVISNKIDEVISRLKVFENQNEIPKVINQLLLTKLRVEMAITRSFEEKNSFRKTG